MTDWTSTEPNRCPGCGEGIGPDERRCPGCDRPLPLHPGHRIAGRYLLLERLGTGGMGTVFRARDDALETDVALKVVTLEDRRSIERFKSEVRLAREVRHPNVCAVYEYGEEPDGSLVYATMELVEGENLRQRRERALLDYRHAADLVRQAASGLQAIHERGLIHRDIKTANLMVTGEGSLRIVDFGIARLLQPDGPTRRTRSGHVVGSPEYMSPEQARGSTLDHRTDLYSLGVVLYELLVGSVPFHGQTPVEVLNEHIHTAPPLDDDSIPDPLRPLLARLLAKSAAERPATAADVVRELGEIRGRLSDTDYVAAIHTPPGSPPWRRLMAVGAAFAVFMAVTAVVLDRWDHREPTTREEKVTETDRSGQLTEEPSPEVGQQTRSDDTGEPPHDVAEADARESAPEVGQRSRSEDAGDPRREVAETFRPKGTRESAPEVGQQRRPEDAEEPPPDLARSSSRTDPQEPKQEVVGPFRSKDVGEPPPDVKQQLPTEDAGEAPQDVTQESLPALTGEPPPEVRQQSPVEVARESAPEPTPVDPCSSEQLVPTCRACPQPHYPARCLSLGSVGVVELELRVDAEGHVTEVRVLKDEGDCAQLREKVVEAAREWTFDPPKVDGQACPSTLTVPFEMRP